MGAVRAFVVTFLLNHGYAGYQAEALAANFWVESRFDYCVASRSGSYLAQWAGSRRQALQRFAGPGCPPLLRQLQFADWELRSRPYDRFWSEPPGRVYRFLRECYAHGRC